MSLKQKIVWKFYFAVILFFAIQKVYFLVTPGSPEYLYYLIIRTFDPIFYFAYSAHILHVLLNIIHCIPLFLYIHRIHLFNPTLWKCLFILRCIFEVTGHSYTNNIFAAFYHVNPKIVLLTFVIALLPQIPSYLVCYWYAFRRNDQW